MTRSAISVRPAASSDDADWDAYLESDESATLYHTTAWRDFIGSTFGHRPEYLIAERNGRTCGVLPMFRISFPVLGSKLISMPYDVAAGGPLTRDRDAAEALVTAAREVAERRRVDYLEFRCGKPNEALEDLGCQRSEPLQLSEIDELPDAETMWRTIRKTRRTYVRRAQRAGVSVRDASEVSDLEAFYEIYLKVFRRFGTPPYGMQYIRNLWSQLHGKGLRVLVAEADGRCLGGMILFVHGRTLVAKIGAVLPEVSRLKVTDAIYWRMILTAIESGCSKLSFGSSSKDADRSRRLQGGLGRDDAAGRFLQPSDSR